MKDYRNQYYLVKDNRIYYLYLDSLIQNIGKCVFIFTKKRKILYFEPTRSTALSYSL